MADTGARLLVVDDDPRGRRMLRRALERRGHLVEEADSGAAGLARIQAGGLDAVLLDLRMPGELSGIDVVRRLRQGPPEIGSIPIIIVSASVHADVRAIMDELDVAGFVEKPVEFGDLYATLEGVLG